MNSIDKKFFFIRTKIVENVRAEMRKKSFSEDAMLARNSEADSSENLGDLLSSEQGIFLISDHDPKNSKLDFDCLWKVAAASAVLISLYTILK